MRCEVPFSAQGRAEADFHIPDVLRRVIRRELVGNSLQRRPVLHEGQGHGEAIEVLLEAGRATDGHGIRQSPYFVGGELQHGCGAQRAVEVDVQLGFRELAETVRHGPRAGSAPPRSLRRCQSLADVDQR